MRVQPFAFIKQEAEAAAAGPVTAFPDQSLTTWTTTTADDWLAYGASVLNTTTFAYSGSSVRIGSDYGTGVAKWQGGSLASNGKIYTSPHVRTKWAVIDTDTDTITEPTTIVNGSSQGSVYDKITNQVISFGDGGTKIDCSTDTASNISGPPNRTTNPIQSFAGDELYGLGFFGYTGIRKYTVSTDTTSTVTPTGDAVIAQGEMGTLGRDGQIYTPNVPTPNITSKYNPDTNVNTQFARPGGENFTTIVQHYDGILYYLPQSAFGTLRGYNPSTSSWVADYDWGTGFQVSNACIGLDGRIYCVTGQSTGTVKWYDPTAGSHGTITISNSDTSYQGITIGKNGDLYLIPWTAAYFHKIPLVTGTGTTATDIVSQYNFGGRLCWPG